MMPNISVLQVISLLSQCQCNYRLNFVIWVKIVWLCILWNNKNIYKTLKDCDLIIVSSIAGGFFKDHIETMRELVKTEAYVIAITQLEEFPYSDKVDMILRVGNDHHSLIGKFSITYIFEVLEALYHLKYGMKSNEKSNDY